MTHPAHRIARLGTLAALGLLLSVSIVALQTEPAPPAPFTVNLPKSVAKLQMVPVPGGKIKIGDREVEVKPFYMATTETPWEAFDAFLASGPPSQPYDQRVFPADAVARPSRSYIVPDLGWGRRGYPVINLNFTSAEMFCRWLSQVSGRKFRLPTEAEWELAARAGGAKPEIDNVAWHAGNAAETTQPVGKKAANAFGIFDLLGNVGEWAMDLDGKPVLCGPTFRDPAGQQSPSLRRRHTPKWQESDPQMPKSRWWLSDGPFVGFRVVAE